MILIFALAIAAIFGAGAFLMLERDLLRVAAGTTLIALAAIVLIMAAGLLGRQPPIAPIASEEAVSDPLVQALALTAVVINLAISALLLSLVYRVFTSHQTIDQKDLEVAEREDRTVREAEGEWC